MIKKLIDIFKSLIGHKFNFSVVFITQILTAIGSLVGVRLLTEFLSPGIYGEYKLVLSSISFLIGFFIRPFIQFAMLEYHVSTNLKNEGSYLIQIRNLYNKYAFIVLLMGIIFFIISINLKFKVILIENPLLILTAIISLWFTTKIDFEISLLISKNNQLAAGLIKTLIRWLTPLMIVIVILITKESSLFMMIGTIFIQIPVWVFMLFYNKSDKNLIVKHNQSQYSLFVKAVDYGWPLAVVGILTWVINESDRFFIQYYHNNNEVGIYAAAYGLISAPFIITSGAIAQFSFPIIFKKTTKDESIIKLVNRVLLLNFFIVLLGILFIYLFQDLIAFLGLSEVYRDQAVDLFIWIVIGYGFFAMATSFDLAAYGEKRTKDMLISYFIASAFNIFFNISLIPEYAAKGAAISTMISLIIYFICMALFFYGRLKFNK